MHVFAEVFQRIGHLSISLEKLRTSDQDVQVALKEMNFGWKKVPLDTPDVNFLPMRPESGHCFTGQRSKTLGRVGIQGLQEDKSKAKAQRSNTRAFQCSLDIFFNIFYNSTLNYICYFSKLVLLCVL